MTEGARSPMPLAASARVAIVLLGVSLLAVGCRAVATPDSGASSDAVGESAGVEGAPERSDDPASQRELREEFLDSIRNEPVYFAVGSHERTTAKIQLSFQYEFYDLSAEPVIPTIGTDAGLYFGYTQTSLWDLDSESRPFLDSSYRPSLYWSTGPLPFWTSESSTSGAEFGFEHESNGRDGPDTRGVNILYLEPSWEWPLGERDRLVIAPRLWAYLEQQDENRDIEEYRGYGKLRIEIERDGGAGLALDLQVGDDLDRGSIQVSATYPLSRLLRHASGYFYVQYFNGYGESLLLYDEKQPSQFRIGFAIVR